jgi:NADPH2:quinone reductase
VRAIQVTRFGGPEVLELAELPEPRPQPGEVLVEVSRVGVNYADTLQAENTYLTEPTLPFVPGNEVVGRTPDGRRVLALPRGGGYAERAVAPQQLVFEVPDDVSDGAALALFLQGLTAWHLLGTCAHLASGETVVVHAAAGGVGSLAVQLAKVRGAGRIIATASSAEKRQLARDLGADEALDPAPDGLTDRIKQANGGKDVDIVLEMIGGRAFDASLAALAPFGRLITYGLASREEPTPVPASKVIKRSWAVIGFWLVHCLRRPEMLRGPLTELFRLTAEGRLRPIVGGEYALSQARQAHEDMRNRQTVGKLLLDPSR